jgi:4-aminobutyrate aminotransferase-like enzyme
VIVLENAYHGTTIATVGLSPTKSVGPGGSPLPKNVRVATVPDTYRGRYGRDCSNAGLLYALDVKKQIESLVEKNHKVAAFFCESIQGVGGQVWMKLSFFDFFISSNDTFFLFVKIVYPDGYLQAAYEYVRSVGGLCVAGL